MACRKACTSVYTAVAELLKQKVWSRAPLVMEVADAQVKPPGKWLEHGVHRRNSPGDDGMLD